MSSPSKGPMPPAATLPSTGLGAGPPPRPPAPGSAGRTDAAGRAVDHHFRGSDRRPCQRGGGSTGRTPPGQLGPALRPQPAEDRRRCAPAPVDQISARRFFPKLESTIATQAASEARSTIQTHVLGAPRARIDGQSRRPQARLGPPASARRTSRPRRNALQAEPDTSRPRDQAEAHFRAAAAVRSASGRQRSGRGEARPRTRGSPPWPRLPVRHPVQHAARGFQRARCSAGTRRRAMAAQRQGAGFHHGAETAMAARHQHPPPRRLPEARRSPFPSTMPWSSGKKTTRLQTPRRVSSPAEEGSRQRQGASAPCPAARLPRRSPIASARGDRP